MPAGEGAGVVAGVLAMGRALRAGRFVAVGMLSSAGDRAVKRY